MTVLDTRITFLTLVPKWENTAFASLSCIASWKTMTMFNIHILLYHIVTEVLPGEPVRFFLGAMQAFLVSLFPKRKYACARLSQTIFGSVS